MKRMFELLSTICLFLFLNITLSGCSDMILETGTPIYHHVYYDRPVYVHAAPLHYHNRPLPPRRQIQPRPNPKPTPNHRGSFGHGGRR